jgi:uncharacterized protein YycO
MAIPLDPGAGGMSIDARSLQNADIIVSTTNAKVSKVIRAGTFSPVSHSMLYIGDELIVEAIASGVVLRSIYEAVQDATLAVAYRHPDITDISGLKIRDFVGFQLGKGYNFVGIGQQATYKVCVIGGSIVCQIAARNIKIKRDEFFCSELVFAAYKSVGLKLSDVEPNWSEPAHIPRLSLKKALNYVGHIRA